MSYNIFEEFKIELPSLDVVDKQENPQAIAHFDNGSWDWYVIAGEKRGDDFMLFGLVNGYEKELGFFTLSQIVNAGAILDVEFQTIGVFDIYEDFDLRR